MESIVITNAYDGDARLTDTALVNSKQSHQFIGSAGVSPAAFGSTASGAALVCSDFSPKAFSVRRRFTEK
jgi:hypothetical protein